MRALLFLSVCIPTRLYLAYLPLELPVKWLPVYGLIFILQAVSFSVLYFTNSRLKAGEGGGETVVGALENSTCIAIACRRCNVAS